MERVWTVLVKIFTSETDNQGINESVLFIVVAGLLIALSISIVVARKNNLYHRPKKKEKQVTEVNNSLS